MIKMFVPVLFRGLTSCNSSPNLVVGAE